MTRTNLVFAALVASAIACGNGGSTAGPTSATTPVPVTLTVPGRPSDQVTDVAAVGLSREQLAEIERACEQVEGIPGISEKCIDSIANVAMLPTATAAPGATAAPSSQPPCHEPPCVLLGRARDAEDIGVVVIWDPDPGSTFCRRRAELCSGATVAARSIAGPASTTTPPTTPTKTTGRSPTTGTGTPSWPTPTPPPRTTGS